jgi:hypothetical protein
MDITTKPPATLRLIFAACASAANSPLTVKEKALLWHKLRQGDWAPTPEHTPVPFATVQAWVDGLDGVVRAFVEGMGVAQEETPVC